MVRQSLNYISWKQSKSVAANLKPFYQASTIEQADIAMEVFVVKWDETHPTISRSCPRKWKRLTPLFSYSPDFRKATYTTNDMESVNMSLRKVTTNRCSFPNDEYMIKLLYLALQIIEKKWTMPIRNWKSVLNQFTIIFEDRMSTY